MANNNGDFDNLDNPNHDFCLLGVKSFPGAILFSIETQTTIGYGMAYPNADCGATLPLIYMQVGNYLYNLRFDRGNLIKSLYMNTYNIIIYSIKLKFDNSLWDLPLRVEMEYKVFLTLNLL